MFIKQKSLISHISSQEWLVRMTRNEKEVHWLDTGWTMWPWPLTSPISLTLDFKGHILMYLYLKNCWSDWCEAKRKWIRYRADYMTLPFDHTHDLDLEVSASKFEVALSQKREGRLTWYERDMSCPFMTMRLAFVPDSDLRRQHAVDISS